MMIPDLRVSMTRTDELVPYARNSKEHPEWQIDQIAASIEEFGFSDPIGIWHDESGFPVIVEGHGRVLAAKLLGIEEVPTICLDHLDDEGRKAYGIVQNKLNMDTGFDMSVLEDELSDIVDIDMTAYGFDDEVYEAVSEVSEIDQLERQMAEHVDGEVPFTEYIDEVSNYVVLKFTREGDWLRAQSVLGIGTVEGFSTSRSGNTTFTGIGRVIDGNEAFERIAKAEEELSR